MLNASELMAIKRFAEVISYFGMPNYQNIKEDLDILFDDGSGIRDDIWTRLVFEILDVSNGTILIERYPYASKISMGEHLRITNRNGRRAMFVLKPYGDEPVSNWITSNI